VHANGVVLARSAHAASAALLARASRSMTTTPDLDQIPGSRSEAETAMIPLLTLPAHPHGDITRVHGIVSASSVRNKNVLIDLYVAARGLLGGVAVPYEDLLNEAVVASANGLAEAAHSLGATHVVDVRFEKAVLITRLIISTQFMITAYGTAVDIRMHDGAPAAQHRERAPRV